MVETPTAYISLLKSNIVKMKFKQDIEADIEDIKQNHEAALKLTKGEKHLVLLDVRGYVMGSDKAKAFCASKKPVPYRIAVAALVDSLAVRLRCNAFVKFHKPVVPTRLFAEDQHAIDWLMGFSQQNIKI